MQWTPYGMGRRAGALPELAERSGVTLVAATGLHQAAHYSGPPENRTATGSPGCSSAS